MEISHPNVTSGSEQPSKAGDWQFQKQLEYGLNQLKKEMAEQPFLYAGIAFVAGFVSNTFPARILYHVLVRLVSWLLGPVILLMGVIKLSDLFTDFRRKEPTIFRP
jgi:hypothetical protein